MQSICICTVKNCDTLSENLLTLSVNIFTYLKISIKQENYVIQQMHFAIII